MRIVMVSNNYTPYSGGVVSSLNTAISALQAAGHDVILITLQFLDDHTDDPAWVVRIPACFRFKYKRNHMSIPWRPDYCVEQEISKLAPEIIHSHHPFLLGNSALKAAKKLNIPIVFTYHTVYEKYFHYFPLPAWFSVPIIKKLVRNYCVQADGIIVPSRAIAEYVQAQVSKSFVCDQMSVNTRENRGGEFVRTQEGSKKLCAIIASGILPVFVLRDHWIDKKRDFSGPFKLLTVGRFVPEKNMLVLLDLFSQLDQTRFSFTLVGYGTEFEHAKNYAYGTLKLSPKQVRFVYKPEKRALAQEYRAADLFLFSSTTDTQGLVLAESMAAGTPVLTFDGPGQRDIVRDGYNGFLVLSAEQMREKIELLARDVVFHEQLCLGAHETAFAYYPDQIVAKLHEFYQLF